MTGLLTGRTAIVTGGSLGLGLEIARAFVESGARVHLCARDEAALERARAELEPLAPEPGFVGATVADVSDPAAVERVVEDALEGRATGDELEKAGLIVR